MADGRLVLVYDGECDFCGRLARWLEQRDRNHRVLVKASQESGLVETLGLTRDEVGRAAWAIEPGGARFEGAAAISRALRELGGVWLVLGSLYLVPPLGWMEDTYYRRIARRRRWG